MLCRPSPPGLSSAGPKLDLNWQNNLDAHVLSCVHQLPINDLLVCTDTVVLCVSWVCGRGNLNLTPFSVTGHEPAARHELLEALVHSLIFDTAFALDQRGFYRSIISANQFQ